MASVLWTYAIVALDEAKARLGLGVATTYDTEVERMINEVSQAMETYCGRYFKERSGLSEFYSPNGGSILSLDHFPVTATTTFKIYVDADRDFGEDTLLDADDYYLDLKTGVVKLIEGEFPAVPGSVKALYSAGFGSTAIPYDLRKACKRWVASVFAESKDHRQGLKSLSSGQGETTTYELDEPPEGVVEILNRYRKMNV